MVTHYRAEIETFASRHDLNPNVIEAIVLVESAGKAHAFRHEPGFWRRYMQGKPEWDGAIPERVSSSYGLMQIMYTTALQQGFDDQPEYLFVPTINLEYGCKHFRWLLNWANDELKAIAAYNGGKGNWDGSRPQRYMARVLNAAEIAREHYRV